MATQAIRRRDWWWLLAYPAYQTIGTFRHEASHALWAWLEGAAIEEFVFWPTAFGWGYVRWEGETTWLATAAPYACDLLTFAAFFVLCTRARFKRHWVWVNLVVVGLVSPLVNSAYNYFRGGDVRRLLAALPRPAVHAYFVVTLILYTVGLILVMRGKVAWGARSSG